MQIDIFSIKGIFNFDGIDKKTIIINLTIIIIFVYLFKGIYLTFLEFYIQKFIQRIKAEISLKLYDKYIDNNYELSVNSNSSILHRNITVEANNFVSGLLEPIIMLAKEFLLIVMLLIFVITIQCGPATILRSRPNQEYQRLLLARTQAVPRTASPRRRYLRQ